MIVNIKQQPDGAQHEIVYYSLVAGFHKKALSISILKGPFYKQKLIYPLLRKLRSSI